MMHTNELALLLSEMLKQMQNNMSGTGQCNKPGGKGKKSGKSLSQNAEQMKKLSEQLMGVMDGLAAENQVRPKQSNSTVLDLYKEKHGKL